MRRTIWSVCILASVLSLRDTACGADDAAAPPLDVKEFNSRPVKERVEFAIAVLDKRDATLANFSTSVSVRVENIGDQGKVTYLPKFVHEFRRLNQKLWGMSEDYASKDAKEVRIKSAQAWDGKEQWGVGYPTENGLVQHVGRIDPKESWTIMALKCLSVLGLRGRDENYVSGGGLARWIEREQTFGPEIVEAEATADGFLSITIHIGPKYHTIFLLDPKRDFMITKMIRRLDGAGVADTLEVVEARQVKGVWIPARMIEKYVNPNKDQQVQTVFEFEKSAIGEVVERDVTIVFPVGTRVVDSIRRICYVKNADGTYLLEPLADAAKGVVRVPTRESVKTIDDTTAQLYEERPIIARENRGQ